MVVTLTVTDYDGQDMEIRVAMTKAINADMDCEYDLTQCG